MCKLVEADNHFFDAKTSLDYIYSQLVKSNIKPEDLTKRDVYVTTVNNKKVKCEFINFPAGCVVVGLIGLNRSFIINTASTDFIVSHNDNLGIVPNSQLAMKSMVVSKNTVSVKIVDGNRANLEKYILNVLCK